MLAQQRRDRGKIFRAAIKLRKTRRQIGAHYRSRGFGRRIRRNGVSLDGRFSGVGVSSRDGQVEPVAAPGDGREGTLAENLAQRGDLHLQVVLLDDESRPHRGEEFVLRDEHARAVRERDQQIKRARTQGDGRTVCEQDALARTQLEPAEAAACKRLGQGGGVAHVGWEAIAAESLAPARILWMGCRAGLRTFQPFPAKLRISKGGSRTDGTGRG